MLVRMEGHDFHEVASIISASACATSIALSISITGADFLAFHVAGNVTLKVTVRIADRD